MHLGDAFIQNDLKKRSISNLSQNQQYSHTMPRLLRWNRKQTRAEEKCTEEKRFRVVKRLSAGRKGVSLTAS